MRMPATSQASTGKYPMPAISPRNSNIQDPAWRRRGCREDTAGADLAPVFLGAVCLEPLVPDAPDLVPPPRVVARLAEEADRVLVLREAVVFFFVVALRDGLAGFFAVLRPEAVFFCAIDQ